jgi:hypothetical protein
MPVPALWNRRKLFTQAFTAGGSVPIELTKYAQTDYISRLWVRFTGTIATGSATAGTATGQDNPEALLQSVLLQTSPVIAGSVPFNAVSGRGIRWDSAKNRGFLINPTAITDGGGTYNANIWYELIFKRRGIRKNIEYSFDIAKYTSALLTLNLGQQTTLFTGGNNTWSFTGLNVEVWAESDFNTNPDQEHAHELFEQSFNITATQTDYPINQLPPGFLYTDLMFLAEDNNALSNAIINNIDIEGGGRIWTPAGDNNASTLQRCVTALEFDGSVGLSNLTGVYSIGMRDGMFSRQIDALKAPIIIKLNVTGPGSGHTFNVRLVGRRMVPGAVKSRSVSRPSGSKSSLRGGSAQ